MKGEEVVRRLHWVLDLSRHSLTLRECSAIEEAIIWIEAKLEEVRDAEEQKQ